MRCDFLRADLAGAPQGGRSLLFGVSHWTPATVPVLLRVCSVGWALFGHTPDESGGGRALRIHSLPK